MQSTGPERRGLITLLTIIALLIIAAVIYGRSPRKESSVSDTKTPSVYTVGTARDTTVATKKTGKKKKTAKQAPVKQYRERDFYNETVPR